MSRSSPDSTSGCSPDPPDRQVHLTAHWQPEPAPLSPVEETGGDFLWRFETAGPHPIESIQAQQEVRRLAATNLEHYPEWVDTFARHVNR